MNFRRKILLVISVAITAVGLGTVAVSQYEPAWQLMYCGHPARASINERIKVLLGGHVHHHCKSRDVVMRLQILAHTDVGELPQESEQPDYFNGLQYTLKTNGTNWSIIVPEQEKLAGHYLLTSAGHLHFHAIHAATTNDFVLHDWSH